MRKRKWAVCGAGVLLLLVMAVSAMNAQGWANVMSCAFGRWEPHQEERLVLDGLRAGQRVAICVEASRGKVSVRLFDEDQNEIKGRGQKYIVPRDGHYIVAVSAEGEYRGSVTVEERRP